MNEARNGAIRNGLLQYAGALLAETNREGAEAAHVALAQLSEVWLEISKTKNGKHYDVYKAKPVLRACSVILKDYCSVVKEALGENDSVAVQKKLTLYLQAANLLDEIVEVTKESQDE